MKYFLILTISFIIHFASNAQSKPLIHVGQWRAAVIRADQKEIIFNFETIFKAGKWTLLIRNGDEKLSVKNLQVTKDSVNFEMPVFESYFKSVVQSDGSLKGSWFKGTAQQTQQWPFQATPRISYRFAPSNGKALFNVSGRWKMDIVRPNGTIRPAIAEFVQKGNYLTGTVLTPSGDYRYLEGIVSGKQLELSVFDGSHSYYFNAFIENASKIEKGVFYSGIAGMENWSATKDPTAKLPDLGNTPSLKEGFSKLDFSFKDLDRNIVSINDERFKNKVVVIQIMGSWCPNCMDETKFLSDFYTKYKQKGVEVLSLAYEYSTDFERSRASLLKFKERFKVEYPMLITGVWVNDSLRTEKTLPQITPIKVFPTTIYLGKNGEVKAFDTGFVGPGTGSHYEAYQKEFYNRIEALLKE